MKLKGTVKWWNDSKGFGFISRTDGGKDVFAHYTQLQGSTGYRTLVENQEVEFEVMDTERGPQAMNIVATGKTIQPSESD